MTAIEKVKALDHIFYVLRGLNYIICMTISACSFDSNKSNMKTDLYSEGVRYSHTLTSKQLLLNSTSSSTRSSSSNGKYDFEKDSLVFISSKQGNDDKKIASNNFETKDSFSLVIDTNEDFDIKDMNDKINRPTKTFLEEYILSESKRNDDNPSQKEIEELENNLKKSKINLLENEKAFDKNLFSANQLIMHLEKQYFLKKEKNFCEKFWECFCCCGCFNMGSYYFIPQEKLENTLKLKIMQNSSFYSNKIDEFEGQMAQLRERLEEIKIYMFEYSKIRSIKYHLIDCKNYKENIKIQRQEIEDIKNALQRKRRVLV